MFLHSHAEMLERRTFLSVVPGSVDPSFNFNPALFTGGAAAAVAIQPDGKILEAGGVGNAFAIARFKSNGLLDRGFGSGGRVTTTFGDASASAHAIAVQKDGKFVVAGLSGTGSASHMVVARYLSGGVLDTTFGNRGSVAISFLGADAANALAIQADGAIDVAGAAKNSAGHLEFALARLTPAGLLDSRFGSGGKALTNFSFTGGFATAMALQSNGFIVAGGQYDTGAKDAAGNGIEAFALARYTASGKLDTTFGRNGVVASPATNGHIAALAIATAGKIVAAGQSHVNTVVVPADGRFPGETFTESSLKVARYNGNGALDASFGAGGVAQIKSDGGRIRDLVAASGMALQANGSIVVVGSSAFNHSLGGSGSNCLAARFTPGGALDATFAGGGVAIIPLAGGGPSYSNAAAIQTDGKVVAVGSNFDLIRYTTSGRLDDGLGYHGTVQNPNGMTGPIMAMAVQGDGKIIAVGSELSPADGEPTDAAIVRYNSNGTLDASFGIDGKHILRIGNVAGWNAVAIRADGKIVVGGHGEAGARTEFAILRYLPNGAGDATFGAGGLVLTAFGSATQQQCNAVLAEADGDVIAVGSAGSGAAVAKYLSTGKLDPTFGVGGQATINNAQANSAARLSDGRILLAGSRGVDFGVFRLLQNGKPDPSFAVGGAVSTPFSNGDSAISSIAVDALGRVVAGGSAGDQYAVARYLANGKLDTTFVGGGKRAFLPDANYPFANRIESVAIQADGKILLSGSITAAPANFSFQPTRVVALRLASNGVTDTTFRRFKSGEFIDSGSFAPVTVSSALALQGDGKILVSVNERISRLFAG